MIKAAQKIPAGWEVLKISDACEIINGKTPLRNNQDYWYNGDIPWFTVDDIRNQGRRINSTKQNISELGLKESGVKLLPKNTVLICCTASVGEYAIATIPITTNQQFNGLVIKDRKQISPDFLFQASSQFEKQLKFLMGTTAFGFVSKSQLGSIEFLVPPLNEQTKIATILSKVDEEIEKVERIIEQTEKLKKGLMQKLLTKGIGHTKFKQTELGEIPEEWEVQALGLACDFIDYRGKTPQKTDFGIRLITAKNVRMGYISTEPKEYIDEDNYDSWMTRGFPKYGDVLFTTEAPLGYVAQLKTHDKVALAQRIIALQPKSKKLLADFLAYALMSNHLQNVIQSMGTGGTVRGIKAKLLKKLIIPVPSYEEQVGIAKILSSVDDKTSIYQKIKSHFLQLKKGLMNDLLSGKVRTLAR